MTQFAMNVWCTCVGAVTTSVSTINNNKHLEAHFENIAIKSTMTTGDFVRWEDLDLDYFLEDYTDDEVTVECVPIEESDSDTENVPPAKRPRKQSKSANSKVSVSDGYICPVCGKELKTIGGFRGHVTKQHNNPHLKRNYLFMKPGNMKGEMHYLSYQYHSI